MYEFEEQRFAPPPSGGKTPKQLKLPALFVLTTIIAVAMSGYSRGQTHGVWIALFSFWFILLGLACLVFGITSRTNGRFFLLAVGIVMLALGMFVFGTLEYW